MRRGMAAGRILGKLRCILGILGKQRFFFSVEKKQKTFAICNQRISETLKAYSF
jgi:hypothetical protein